MNQWQCPIDEIEKNQVLLGHGSGGELTHQLIERYFRKYFKDPLLDEAHDSVCLDLQMGNEEVVVMSVDSFVVNPLFFPGGNIGKLSVIGTINDLAMSGAEPLYLSCAFIIEEGLKLSTLEKIIQNMAEEAEKNNVRIVCGDTKVVERGRGDGIFITTTGLGRVKRSQKILPLNIQENDVILISGDIGRHGMAVMSEREHLNFSSQIVSDCQALWPLIKKLKEENIPIHCLRDLSRGGLATSLVELAETSGYNMRIDEELVPVGPIVRSACEILGIDPFFVANEGTCVLIIPEDYSDAVLKIGRNSEAFPYMQCIGRVESKVKNLEKAKLYLKTLYGIERRLFRLNGDQLPRIC
jgi:hydrogenase expression/formation protein HypE